MQSLKSVEWRIIIGLALIVFGVSNIIFLQKKTSEAVITQVSSSNSLHSALTTPLLPVVTPTLAASAVPTSTKIRLTTATQSELETLPGIGPAKAAAIIEYRQSKGFKSVNDLDKVKGIGPTTLAKLKPLIEL